MAKEKFSSISEAVDLTSFDSFVGIRDNGDGTFSNYRFTYAQIAALAQGSNKKIITVTDDGSTLTDVFFDTNTITEIDTNNQVYIVGVDFSQNGDTITGLTITFFIGQVLIAKV